MEKSKIKFTEIVAPNDVLTEGLSDICGGVCILYRIRAKETGFPYDVCQYDDQGMKAFLEEFTLNHINHLHKTILTNE